MRYLDDGARLYEVVAQDIRRNYGLGGSLIREAAVRDVVTGVTRLLSGARLAALREVRA